MCFAFSFSVLRTFSANDDNCNFAPVTTEQIMSSTAGDVGTYRYCSSVAVAGPTAYVVGQLGYAGTDTTCTTPVSLDYHIGDVCYVTNGASYKVTIDDSSLGQCNGETPVYGYITTYSDAYCMSGGSTQGMVTSLLPGPCTYTTHTFDGYPGYASTVCQAPSDGGNYPSSSNVNSGSSGSDPSSGSSWSGSYGSSGSTFTGTYLEVVTTVTYYANSTLKDTFYWPTGLCSPNFENGTLTGYHQYSCSASSSYGPSA